jgi:asparagine synthase (glutamine-hydrolysing)
MGSTLAHRGPDDEQVISRDGVGLCFRRLSIIDLQGGAQPLWNEEGDVACVLNGEIYNFKELRVGLEERGHLFRTASDAEVIVHLYEDLGDDFVEELAGMFAIAVVDYRQAGQPRVLLVRDRLGVKPLYWSATEEGGLAFASEPKALLAGGYGARSFRGSALLDYLVLGWCGGPHSAWDGIERLEPGHRLSWSAEGGSQLEVWWDVPLEPTEAPVSDEELLARLDEAVHSRLVSDVPLGAFLSGGLDSGAVVTSMVGAADPLVCLSVGFSEQTHDESELARLTAARAGAQHHEEVMDPLACVAAGDLAWNYDEPLADPSTVPTYLVSLMARRHVTVALSGDGGDEVFAGYRRYGFVRLEQRLRGAGASGLAGAVERALPADMRGRNTLQNIADHPALAFFRSVSQVDQAQALSLLGPDALEAVGQHDPSLAFQELWERPRCDDDLYRAQYVDMKTWLPEDILAKTDRASMAVSLEVRVPLLDHRLVQRFAPTPAAYKMRGMRGKRALRRALRARLSPKVLAGKKRGFDTPVSAWLRGPLRDVLEGGLRELPAGWFSAAALQRLNGEHQSGKKDHGRLLWSLLTLQRWRSRHEVVGLVG